MKDEELDHILKSARVPNRSGEYWDHFAERVVGRLQEQPHRPGTEDPRGADILVRVPSSPAWRERLASWRLATRLAAAAGIALVCVVAGFTIGYWNGRRAAGADQQIVEAAKYFREVQVLFPNQLQAIVFDGQGTRLDLADQANVPSSPALYVRILGPEGCKRFVTFSGQRIQFDREVCEVLVDRQGHVLLVGDHLVWSSAEPAGKAGRYHIEAALLGTAS